MKKPFLKAILSTLLILIVLFLALSGALLYFGKTGMVWGISRQALREFHFCVAIAMCLLAAVHLVLNFRLYTTGLKALARRGKRSEE